MDAIDKTLTDNCQQNANDAGQNLCNVWRWACHVKFTRILGAQTEDTNLTRVRQFTT
jgi:hypothetical protein